MSKPILTVRPKGMSQEAWKAFLKEQKQEIAKRISRPIWFAKGLQVQAGHDGSGKPLYATIVQPMDTYRRGMKTLE